MIILQLAGFLGSGKTTLMVRLGSALGKAGKKVAVIVNEVGEVGVDGQVIEAYGLRTVELTEGCICCSLSGSLQNTIRILAKEYKPDIVLIEPTGLALPSKVNAILRTSMVETERTFTVAIVDAYRARKVLNETRAFFSRQISAVDLIALNKIDIVDAALLDEIEQMVSEINPEPPIVRISAKTGEGFDELFARLGVS